MKKPIVLAFAVALAGGLSAAVAVVQEVKPGVRPVYNSGTGVMPHGAQEAMPKAARQLAKDGMRGAGWTPAMFSVVTPLQFPGPDYDVGGLRCNLFYGECVNFDGFDFGLVGVARNHANGWLANLAANIAGGDGIGLNTGIVNWYGGDFKGMQFGIANWAESGDFWQVGFYNGSGDAQGFQLGVINTAGMMQGLQIGLVNIIGHCDLPFLPIVNWHY